VNPPRSTRADELDLHEVTRVVGAMPGLVAAVAADRQEMLAVSPDMTDAIRTVGSIIGRHEPLHSPAAQRAAERTASTGAPAHLRRVPVHVGDRLAFIDISVRALPVPEEPSLVLMVVEDVSLEVETGLAEQAARAEARATDDRYRMLFDHNQLGIVVHAPDGGLVDVNPAALRILGASSIDELLGRDSDDPRWGAVRPDGQPFPGREHPAMSTLRTGEPTYGVVMGVADQTEGRRRWLRVSASAVRRDNAIDAVVATFEDITEQFTLQQQLGRRTAVLDALMAASPVGFALIDADRRFVQVNDALARLAGTTPAEVEGRPVADVLPELTSDHHEFERVLHSGDSVTAVRLTSDPNDPTEGERAWRIDYRPVKVGDELIAVGCVVVDLTEQRRVERLRVELERERHRAELDAIERTLDEERKAVRVLQDAVIPTQLPVVAGATIAARYESASVGPNVGGDWFDVITHRDRRRVVVVVGDVVGHGVVAARQMLQLRHWTSLLVSAHDRPSDVLGALNRAVHGLDAPIMATVLVASIDLDDHRLTWASAGHLPPIVKDVHGTRVLDADVLGCPLGVLDELVASDNVMPFTPGSTLLCYTDGLVERSDEVIDDGLDRLCAVMATAGTTPEALCDEIVERLVRAGNRRDDACVVAVQAS
jgi:PAS domain S-box-containing protein